MQGVRKPFLKHRVLVAFNAASVTMLAALATLACALAIAPVPATAVLGVLLCLSLSRSHLERARHGRIEAALALPLVGLAAIGIGVLLHRLPALGALLFVTAISLSIWLRRLGAVAARLGSLISLPFVALLVTPPVSAAPDSPVPAFALPIVVGMLALFWVTALHTIARRAGLSLPTAQPRPAPVGAPRAGALRPDASTRMALQMAATLGLAFAIGHVFFPARWSWIVLTAFIVASGNRGRIDVAYKSVLRVAGAAAGTLVSLLVSQRAGGHDAGTIALILAALFAGTWLRPFGYAWWALFVTIAFALLQGFSGGSATSMLAQRLEEIVIGAAIAVACAWFVLPVRSSAVLRRRLADALAALSDAFDPGQPLRSPTPFLAALGAIEHMAPAFRAGRVATGWLVPVQPAEWIELLLACRAPAHALIEREATPADVRRAIGAARKSLVDAGQVAPALRALAAALAAHQGRQPAG
jgi:hypothetical protein